MEGEILKTNFVKRRRSSLDPEQQAHAISLVDQPDATPVTTTIKRCSKFRGISRHHQSGRYEARFGNRYFYLGTSSILEEPNHAYDMAAIEHRGIDAVTKFDHAYDIAAIEHRGIKAVTKSDLNTCIRWHRSVANPICSQQDSVKRKMQIDSSNKSSATALGILLRSSMFKELVEKNMNDETEENERKKFKPQSDDDKMNFVE